MYILTIMPFKVNELLQIRAAIFLNSINGLAFGNEAQCTRATQRERERERERESFCVIILRA
jgi:hypothetical protein